MVEAIRLVVWDLDDTFWRGTLSEGGMAFVPSHKELVIELARRGIISSICSKNDFAAVNAILEENGIWEYFIFPSINWEPKGQRIAALIETVQLRPETVMFIDDNPMNLQEAIHFTPGLQIWDPKIIPTLLDSPFFKGKDDRELTRLKQYKLLETRKAAEISTGTDTTEFLRKSNIRVVIDYDVESNIDRAIELVNRTNQLNFTKNRLPEESELAKAQLRDLLRDHMHQAALVRVKDNYGDYGYCGFYVEKRAVRAGSGLVHFCFSCRILGMQIETWLYRRLGRPVIQIKGDVLTDIKDENPVIDWIHIDSLKPIENDVGQSVSVKDLEGVGRIILRGGCDLLVVSHYFGMATESVIGEFAFNRDQIHIRREHSLILRYAIDGLSDSARASLERLGFRDDDFKTRLLDGYNEKQVWILTFWGDAIFPIYRHRDSGTLVAFSAQPAVKDWWQDATRCDISQIDKAFDGHWVHGALKELRDEYEFQGLISEQLFKENLDLIFSKLPENARAFVIGSNESSQDCDENVRKPYQHLNAWCIEAIEKHKRVTFIDVRPFIRANETQGWLHHFDRKVYYRIYAEIARRMNDR